MTKKVRLDTLIVARGLAPSRERAQALVLAGRILVPGVSAAKPGMRVPDDTALTVRGPDHPYVGRGGIKLAHALDAFGIAPRGRHALDVGASTGGFTDVLLRRGAASVVALDVGHGQLAWSLRQDPRVTVLEGVNARHLAPADLPADRRRFDLITIDVAFISLRHVLPAVVALLAAGADTIALVKPQFEAGRAEVGKGGLVRDPAVHARVVEEIVAFGRSLGLHHAGTVPSPISGADGNREFFVHFVAARGARA